MPKTGTLTQARIAEAVVDTNGYTQQKSLRGRRNNASTHQALSRNGRRRIYLRLRKILCKKETTSQESSYRRGYDYRKS
jgi:hypothetical protein